MDKSEDFYLQAIGQVKTSQWYKNRFVLVGDAGYCPSPASGMGTSAAITGAYMPTEKTHKEAFESYDKIFRPYIDRLQTSNGLPDVPKISCPQSSWAIWVLHRFLATASFAVRVSIFD
jgi:2-polyprenyl-6-methoxyphenol hydroxylase-like FAD-dependent oxidoreductase